MWDSSGLTAKTAANSSRALATFAAQEKRDALRTVPDRARKSELTTEVRDGNLVIRPDLALLRGKDTTYPVAIDPWTTIGKSIWGYTGTENATRDDGVARVGKNPDGSGNYRSFFRFNLTSLSGKTIRSAKFLTEMTHSWSCTSTPVNLYRTAELGSSGKQSWDGPNLITWLDERSGHAHKPPATPSCDNDPQPDLPMEFSNTNLRDDISANRGEDRYTLALAARQSDGTSESESTWWKKFDPAMTKLTVEYNTNPNTPTAAQLSTHAGYTGPAQACVTGASRPMVRSDYPWLKATLTDPDGSNGGSLSGVFTLQKLVSGAWATPAAWPKTDAGVAPGAKAEVQLTTKTASGDVYRWQVQAKDTLGGISGGSPWCEFYVDYAAPTAMPKVTPADGLYLESPPLGTNQDVHGSAGYSGRFTFSANGAADVYDYVYQVAGGAEQVVKAATLGGSATVWVTPNSIGENVLSVKSRDQAGNATSAYDYVFLVDSPSAAKAHWAINELLVSRTNLGTAPADSLAESRQVGPWTRDSALVEPHLHSQLVVRARRTCTTRVEANFFRQLLRSALRVVGRRVWPLDTGAVVTLEAQRLSGIAVRLARSTERQVDCNSLHDVIFSIDAERPVQLNAVPGSAPDLNSPVNVEVAGRRDAVLLEDAIRSGYYRLVHDGSQIVRGSEDLI